MSAASIAAEVEGVGGQPISAQTICRTLHQIGLHGSRPRRKPLLKMMHKKARKQLQHFPVALHFEWTRGGVMRFD